MDLTRLYNLTTPELRAEAQRLGMLDVATMTRAQLIQVIRSELGAPQPDGFLGRVFGFAKRALSPAELAASSNSSRPSSTARAFESEPARLPAPQSTGPAPAPAKDSASTDAQQRAFTTAIRPKAPAAADSSTNRYKPGAPAGVFSVPSQQLIGEEPFPTQTMARILAEQGHYKRALAIYAALLRKSPFDAELQREADAVRHRTGRVASR